MAAITPKNGRVAFITAQDPHTYWELNSTNLGTNYGHDATGNDDNTNVSSGDISTQESYEGMNNQNDPPASGDFDVMIVTDACALIYIPADLAHGTVYGLWHNGGNTNAQAAYLRATTTGVEIAIHHNNGNGVMDCLIEEIPDADLPGWFAVGWQFASYDGNQGDMALWLNGTAVRNATRVNALDYGSGNPDFGNASCNDIDADSVRDPSSYGGGDWGTNNAITGSGILIANFTCDNPTNNGSGDSSPGAGNDFYTDYYDEHADAAVTTTTTTTTSTSTSTTSSTVSTTSSTASTTSTISTTSSASSTTSSTSSTSSTVSTTSSTSSTVSTTSSTISTTSSTSSTASTTSSTASTTSSTSSTASTTSSTASTTSSTASTTSSTASTTSSTSSTISTTSSTASTTSSTASTTSSTVSTTSSTASTTSSTSSTVSTTSSTVSTTSSTASTTSSTVSTTSTISTTSSTTSTVSTTSSTASTTSSTSSTVSTTTSITSTTSSTISTTSSTISTTSSTTSTISTSSTASTTSSTSSTVSTTSSTVSTSSTSSTSPGITSTTITEITTTTEQVIAPLADIVVGTVVKRKKIKGKVSVKANHVISAVGEVLNPKVITGVVSVESTHEVIGSGSIIAKITGQVATATEFKIELSGEILPLQKVKGVGYITQEKHLVLTEGKNLAISDDEMMEIVLLMAA